MAQDDMFVIMYKMLAYFYSCMKSGETPQEVHYAHNGDLFNISYTYWVSILNLLRRWVEASLSFRVIHLSQWKVSHSCRKTQA